ncbi:hypothetical protein M5689_006611 [Euphorbia peplus]|nr:hypothetical protein M5689_006611 [Euphorbia peplus]
MKDSSPSLFSLLFLHLHSLFFLTLISFYLPHLCSSNTGIRASDPPPIFFIFFTCMVSNAARQTRAARRAQKASMEAYEQQLKAINDELKEQAESAATKFQMMETNC